ncbi:DUF2442 domain-containing protein [Candidatus Beckwithbacteria bacterium]|nr:DUF2442 domain-containing protein [Candidatus Beckwithbacteria bacterium]
MPKKLLILIAIFAFLFLTLLFILILQKREQNQPVIQDKITIINQGTEIIVKRSGEVIINTDSGSFKRFLSFEEAEKFFQKLDEFNKQGKMIKNLRLEDERLFIVFEDGEEIEIDFSAFKDFFTKLDEIVEEVYLNNLNQNRNDFDDYSFDSNSPIPTPTPTSVNNQNNGSNNSGSSSNGGAIDNPWEEYNQTEIEEGSSNCANQNLKSKKNVVISNTVCQ